MRNHWAAHITGPVVAYKMLQKASTLQIQIQGPGHWLVLYIAIATVLAPTSQTLNLITI